MALHLSQGDAKEAKTHIKCLNYPNADMHNVRVHMEWKESDSVTTVQFRRIHATTYP